MSKRRNITGLRFGRLTVLSAPRRIEGTTAYVIACRCDCGVERDFRRGDVVGGKSKSCGCYNHDRVVERNTTHGWGGTYEYRCWFEMQARCKYRNRAVYKNYGGRGIRVAPCYSGPGGFIAFLNDMGPAPSEKHQVDRIDNSRGYDPGNLRWATRREQGRNRRNNHMVTAFGRTQCAKAWSEELGMNFQTLLSRLRRMRTEEALSSPVEDAGNRRWVKGT
jgi:hypothetical protein